MLNVWKDHRKLTGPVSSYTVYLNDKRILQLFGESHMYNGDNKHKYIPSLILDDFADKPMHILLELSVNYAQMLSIVSRDRFSLQNKSSSYSPIEYISNRFLIVPRSISPHHIIEYIDSRRVVPYVLLTIIYDFESYAFVYHNSISFNKTTKEFKQFKQACKQFEKELYRHISTRKKTHSLLLSFIHPDHNIPEWYIKWLQFFNKDYDINDNDIKNRINELRKKNTDDFSNIINYIDEEMTGRLLNIADYSANFQKLDDDRNTESSNFVMNKKNKEEQGAESLFKILIGILTDLHIILYVLETCDNHDIVAFIGDAHTKSIARFFLRYAYRIDIVKQNGSETFINHKNVK